MESTLAPASPQAGVKMMGEGRAEVRMQRTLSGSWKLLRKNGQRAAAGQIYPRQMGISELSIPRSV